MERNFMKELHDIRSAVGSILMAADLLSQEIGEHNSWVAMIERSADTVMEILNKRIYEKGQTLLADRVPYELL